MEYLIHILPSEPSSADPWTIGTAVASTVIALTAVIFTWLQNRKADNHNRLMVTPHVSSMAIINNIEKKLVMRLENNGIGPAIIKDFSIHIDGKLVEGEDEVESALLLLLKGLPVSGWGHESLTRNSFLPVGKKIELATIISEDLTSEEIRNQLDPRFKMQISYQSIYGDKFCYNTDD
jgi:hypothetical protein